MTNAEINGKITREKLSYTVAMARSMRQLYPYNTWQGADAEQALRKAENELLKFDRENK